MTLQEFVKETLGAIKRGIDDCGECIDRHEGLFIDFNIALLLDGDNSIRVGCENDLVNEKIISRAIFTIPIKWKKPMSASMSIDIKDKEYAA